MRARTTITVLTAALGLYWLPGAVAQELSCANIEFTGPVASQFPNANEYCLDVAERDNEIYAHFAAEVQRVSGNKAYIKFKHPDGSLSDTVAFDPPPDYRINIASRDYRVRDLGRGQELDVWVPSSRWEAAFYDDAANLKGAGTVAAVPIISGEDEYMAAALPSTASPVPLLGMLGAIFITLGAFLRWLRRRPAIS